MLGRLLKKLFGRGGAAPTASRRPTSPPPPVIPTAAAPPPPPPPPPPVAAAQAVAPAVSRAAELPDASAADRPDVVDPGLTASDRRAELDDEGTERARVKLILSDGTTATPGLDPEAEERLRYILDNIVPPPQDPPT